MAKRSYTRRSDEERIAEISARIEKLKAKLETKQRKDSPVLQEIKKVRRVLKKFAQVALDHGRADLANSTQAFAAGLDRTIALEFEDANKRRTRAVKELEANAG